MYVKKISILTAVVLAASLLLAAAGCGNNGSSAGAISFKDDSGRTFSLEKPARRVVSLAPANTEIVYWLGADKKLVGVTTYCDYPPAAKKKTKIGDFATPNVEKISSVDPQVVMATGGLQNTLVKSLSGLGIKVVVFDPTTADGVMTNIRRAAQILGVEDEVAGKIDALEKRVAAVRDKSRSLEARKVFFEVFNQPLTAAGGGTLIDSMITTAGGTNIGAAAGSQFPQYSSEQLFNDDPYAYVAVKGTQQDPSDISKRPGYDKLTAVKDGRVYVVEDNLFVRSGPRAVAGLEALAKIAHPEVFGKYTGEGQ
jgi:iron complex transport system substrate-binding protein